jgi:hypothetical protein
MGSKNRSWLFVVAVVTGEACHSANHANESDSATAPASGTGGVPQGVAKIVP